jgi:hypothetical protein
MLVKITPSYILTDEHGKSQFGVPVLVNMRTNEAYNPSDLLRAYPTWGSMQARDVVRSLVNEKSFTDQEKFFIERFTGKVF